MLFFIPLSFRKKKERKDKQKGTVCEEEKTTNKADVHGNNGEELSDELRHSEIFDTAKQRISTPDDGCQDEKKVKEVADAVISVPNVDIRTLTISEYRGFYLIFNFFKFIFPDENIVYIHGDEKPLSRCKQVT